MNELMERSSLTTAEAARFLDLPVSAVQRLVRQHQLKKLRGFRKPFRFSVSELQRFLRGE